MSQLITCPAARPSLRERGMATVEYALGVLVVVVIIGAIVLAIQTNTFRELLDSLFGALLGWVQKAFEIPFSDIFGKKP